MKITYKMIERRSRINSTEEQKSGFYPQIVRAKTIKIEELALSVARGKNMQAIEMKSVIEMMLSCIEKELLNGNNVCLDGFGTFQLSARCKRSVTNPDEIRAESIEVKRVSFTPSLPLLNRMKIAKFVKSK
jgi:predicted histone-like DNA-binding protein